LKRQRVLIVSPTPTHPPSAGNRIRVLRIADMLSGLGKEVFLLYLQKDGDDVEAMRAYWGERLLTHRYAARRRAGALSRVRRALFERRPAYVHGVDDWYDDSLDRRLEELQARHAFDAVVAEYVFLSRALLCFDDRVRKLLDTHGVFTDRHKAFVERGEKPEWFSTTREEEARGIGRADVVIAIQNQDKAFFQSISDRPVVTVGHPVELKGAASRVAGRYNLLYLGSRNASNLQAATYFMRGVLPALRRRVPEVCLRVAGGICERIGAAEGVVSLGAVRNLDEVYDAADVVINPIQFGTGLKIKSIEAMGYGKPLVTTSIGAQGMEEADGRGLVIADDEMGFMDAIEKLLTDREHYDRMARDAHDYAVHWNAGVVGGLAAAVNG
jgi:glycosyltransferase involved in cell wall biosynthesis